MARSESSVASERQFLLRLPQDQADVLRQALRSSQPLEEKLQLESLGVARGGLVRHAKVVLEGQLMLGKMMDLPCVVESHKTLDSKTLYKAADISQLMVCTQVTPDDVQKIETELENAPSIRESRKQFICNFGLTPPLKNVRKKRFRRTAPKKQCLDMETPEVEREVRRLLREDLQAVNVSIDVVSDEKTPTKRSEGDDGGDDDGEEDSYHGDVYAQLELSSSDNSSDESLYNGSGSGLSADEHDLDLTDNSQPAPMSSEPDSPRTAAMRNELSEVELMIENQEMRVSSQSNPFLKERFMQRLTDLKARQETLLGQMADRAR